MGNEQAQVQWDEGWWDLGDLEPDRPEWDVVERLLPAGWERAAGDCRAMVRRHGSITSASMLLRVLLVHSLDGCSLRETAVRAREGGLADVSDVALLKRLRNSGEWFRG